MKTAISPLLKEIRTNSVIATSGEGNLQTVGPVKFIDKDHVAIRKQNTLLIVKEAPYVANINYKTPLVEKNLIEYMYQVFHSVLLNDYINIPFMRHLKQSVVSYIFDLNTNASSSEISKIITERLENTNLKPVLVKLRAKDKDIAILVHVKYMGMILTVRMLYNLEKRAISSLTIKDH